MKLLMILCTALVLTSCGGGKGEMNKDTKTDSSQAKSDLKEPGQITSYYSEVPDKFIFVDRCVLYTSGQDVIGFYGSAAQGSAEYYLIGKLTGNEINGTKYSLFDSSSTKFTLKVSPKSISGLSLLEKTDVPVDTADLFSKEEHSMEKSYNIYGLPNKSSTILAKEYKLENKGFKLTEIGKMEKGGDESYPYNIWYKIKNKDLEGWVFGMMEVLK